MEPLKCKKCGVIILDDTPECPKCGAALEVSVSEPIIPGSAESISEEAQEPPPQPFLLRSSPLKVFFLSLITINLYNIFWMYKQWKAIKDIPKYKNVSPFWRALFSGIFIFPLIDIITKKAKDTWFLWTLPVVILGDYAISRTQIYDENPLLFLLSLFVVSGAVAYLQSVINDKTAPLKEDKKFSALDITALILGIIFSFIVALGYLLPEEEPFAMPPEEAWHEQVLGGEFKVSMPFQLAEDADYAGYILENTDDESLKSVKFYDAYSGGGEVAVNFIEYTFSAPVSAGDSRDNFISIYEDAKSEDYPITIKGKNCNKTHLFSKERNRQYKTIYCSKGNKLWMFETVIPAPVTNASHDTTMRIIDSFSAL